MEKAVLKTLIYANIFDYPMKAWEVHKWLIGQSLDFIQVEKTLERLVKKGKVSVYKDFYFLSGRKNLVKGRLEKQKQSKVYLKRAKIITSILKIIPWIKLVGISGGLAMDNAKKQDDIDLFIITAKNKLWISRLIVLGFLSLLGKRRKVSDSKDKVAGKFCLNLLLEEDELAQQKHDLYISHEVLQMKVLWQKGEIYSRFLEENTWVFKFLPNWIGSTKGKLKFIGKSWKNERPNKLFDKLNKLAYNFQLSRMNKPKGEERVEQGAVYFHPKDYGIGVMREYALENLT